MSLPEEQSGLVHELGVSTNDMISGMHGSGNYKLLTSEDTEAYVVKALPWAAVPGVLGVLSLLAGVAYCLCSLKMCRRCRSNCCKWWKKQKDEFSVIKAMKEKSKDIRFQYICLSILCVFMLAFAIIGFVANGKFADSITGSGGALDITSDWFVELKAFCLKTRTPIKFIGQNVSSIVGGVVLPLLNETSMIDDGTVELTDLLQNFSLTYSDRTITATDGTYTETFACAVCTTIADKVNDTRDQIISDTQPMFDEMSSTRSSLSVELAAQNATIIDSCTSAHDMIYNAEKDMEDLKNDYEDDLKPEITKMSNLRKLMFSLLFAFPLLPIILSTFTIWTRKTIFLTIQNGLTWFTCSLISIILGIHLLITVVLADVCELNDVVLTKGLTSIEDMGNNNTGVDIIQACLDNTPLIDVFNMSDKLDFSTVIDFDFDFNATKSFDLTALADLGDTIGNTTTSTFNGKGDDALQACNDLIAEGDVTTPDLTRDNIASATASTYFTSAGAKRTELDVLISSASTTINLEASASAEFSALILNMKFDMNVIANYTDDLKSTIVHIENRFNAIEGQMSPIFMAADLLLDTRCGFIGTTYRRLDESICVKMAPSIAAMCLSMILIVLMLLPVCCIGLYLKGNLKKRADRNRPAVFAECEGS